ncbi:hypothetical protein FZEAL_2190 [Fusarium zealandicum]|uniref:Uncharacterized protein n=1 Tax=Fusarium zealandicum TaxID=1053134 RepID=A0A8H4URE7_9HYPO|nr:hypothetical protein FZEAL_2190 [Fusarium zealandicum]
MSQERRRDAASDESYVPPRTAAYDLDLAANLELLSILEHAPTEPLSRSTSPQTVMDGELHRALTLDAVVSTTSSMARKNAKAQQEQSDGFKKVGAGACGAIFSQPGKSIVIKLAKSSDRDDLWNDYLMHKLIAEKFKDHEVTDIKIPECYSFIPKDRYQFWEKHEALTQAAEPICHLPTHGLCTERILPLPQITRHLLI